MVDFKDSDKRRSRSKPSGRQRTPQKPTSKNLRIAPPIPDDAELAEWTGGGTPRSRRDSRTRKPVPTPRPPVKVIHRTRTSASSKPPTWRPPSSTPQSAKATSAGLAHVNKIMEDRQKRRNRPPGRFSGDRRPR